MNIGYIKIRLICFIYFIVMLHFLKTNKPKLIIKKTEILEFYRYGNVFSFWFIDKNLLSNCVISVL